MTQFQSYEWIYAENVYLNKYKLNDNFKTYSPIKFYFYSN